MTSLNVLSLFYWTQLLKVIITISLCYFLKISKMVKCRGIGYYANMGCEEGYLGSLFYSV